MNRETENELSLSPENMADLISAALATGNGFKFKVTGFSMAPFIKNKDVVVLVPIDSGIVEVGDVLACMDRSTDRLVLHRVVAREDTSYILKGDNTLTPDSPMNEESILGRVAGIERNGRSMTLSLGVEKWAIAFLSRIGLLARVIYWARLLARGKATLFSL